MPLVEKEFYATPSDIVGDMLAIACDFVDEPELIVEPSAGAGGLAFMAHAYWPKARVEAFEPHRPMPVFRYDQVVWAREQWETARLSAPADLILANPPFSFALPHVRLMIERLSPAGHAVVLLPLAFVASAKRLGLHQEHPPRRVHVLSARPSFLWSHTCQQCGYKCQTKPNVHVQICGGCGGDRFSTVKTDPYDYAIFVWGARPGEARITWGAP